MLTRERFSLAKLLNELGQWLQGRIQILEDEGKDLERELSLELCRCSAGLKPGCRLCMIRLWEKNREEDALRCHRFIIYDVLPVLQSP